MILYHHFLRLYEEKLLSEVRSRFSGRVVSAHDLEVTEPRSLHVAFLQPYFPRRVTTFLQLLASGERCDFFRSFLYSLDIVASAQPAGKFPPDSLINTKVFPHSTPVTEVVGAMRNFNQRARSSLSVLSRGPRRAATR